MPYQTYYQPAKIAGSVTGSSPGDFSNVDNEVWSFTVHKFGDLRSSCANIGPEYVDPIQAVYGNKLPAESKITAVTIAAPLTNTFEFSQDEFLVNLEDIIGNAIQLTSVQDSSGAAQDVNRGCCVIGKGTPTPAEEAAPETAEVSNSNSGDWPEENYGNDINVL